MFLFYVLIFFKKGDTIQGGTLFKGGHYLRKYGIHLYISPCIDIRKVFFRIKWMQVHSLWSWPKRLVSQFFCGIYKKVVSLTNKNINIYVRIRRRSLSCTHHNQGWFMFAIHVLKDLFRTQFGLCVFYVEIYKKVHTF